MERITHFRVRVDDLTYIEYNFDILSMDWYINVHIFSRESCNLKEIFSVRVKGDVKDILIAKAAMSCDENLSVNIVSSLVFSNIIDPLIKRKMSGRDKTNWFETHLKKLWDSYYDCELSSRFETCKMIYEQ